MLWFVIMVVVSSHFELVCYTSNLSLCDVLVTLDMNLDGFTGGLSAIIGSLSIDLEFPSIVEKLLKKAFYVFDDCMLR